MAEFNFSNLQNKILILGDGGYTKIIKNIIYNLSGVLRYCVLIANENIHKEYKNWIPDILMYETLYAIEKIMLDQTEFRRKHNNFMELKHTVVIIIDGDLLDPYTKSSIVDILFNTSRHYYIIPIVFSKHPRRIPQCIRYNVSQVITTGFKYSIHQNYFCELISLIVNMINPYEVYKNILFRKTLVFDRYYGVYLNVKFAKLPIQAHIGTKQIWKINDLYMYKHILTIQKRYYDVHFRYYYI